jgi:hypothetical protein
MNIPVALALLASGVFLFWATGIATRLAQPPRWVGDTMVMCLIAPMIVFLWVMGVGILGYAILSGAWRSLRPADLLGIGVMLVICVLAGFGLARWSRRAPRAASADVIPMTRPESPEPPRPAPQLGASRKAA